MNGQCVCDGFEFDSAASESVGIKGKARTTAWINNKVSRFAPSCLVQICKAQMEMMAAMVYDWCVFFQMTINM